MDIDEEKKQELNSLIKAMQERILLVGKPMTEAGAKGAAIARHRLHLHHGATW